ARQVRADAGPAGAAEAQRADGRLGGQGVQQDPGQVRVVGGVVHERAVHRADLDVLEPVRHLPPDAQEGLVVVGEAVLADVEDQVVQGGVAGAECGGGADGELVDGAVLAAEPSLPRQPLREGPHEGRLGSQHARPALPGAAPVPGPEPAAVSAAVSATASAPAPAAVPESVSVPAPASASSVIGPGTPSASSGGISWNQKKPCAGSVMR